MAKEILRVVDTVAHEKDLPKEEIFEALEHALARAIAKRYGEEIDVRVEIDRKSGDYRAFRRYQVVDEVQDRSREISLEEAKRLNPEAKVGDTIEEPIETVELGRIAAQIAKQVIIQKVREAERRRAAERYRDRVGQILTGIVKKVDRQKIVVDLGDNAEAILPREELILREIFRVGDRVRALLKEIREDGRGPTLILSRTDPRFLAELFRMEVPEVAEGAVEIVGVARDPGSRAKVAVRAVDPRVDPIGACIGMRGSRINTMSEELRGERIDLILWDENEAQYVINAMAPAEITSLVVDEDQHRMVVVVPDERLAQAIGRDGQNVRLASQLTGWEIDVIPQSEWEARRSEEREQVKQTFMALLDIDEALAEALVDAGFTSLDEVAYVPTREFLEAVEGLDEETVEELKRRAQDALLIKAMAEGEEKVESDLLHLEGVDERLAKALMEKGISSREELAEMSVDELLELLPDLSREKAAKLIMKAREPWFAEAEPHGGGDSG